jgi:hypothetical protein
VLSIAESNNGSISPKIELSRTIQGVQSGVS